MRTVAQTFAAGVKECPCPPGMKVAVSGAIEMTHVCSSPLASVDLSRNLSEWCVFWFLLWLMSCCFSLREVLHKCQLSCLLQWNEWFFFNYIFLKKATKYYFSVWVSAKYFSRKIWRQHWLQAVPSVEQSESRSYALGALLAELHRRLLSCCQQAGNSRHGSTHLNRWVWVEKPCVGGKGNRRIMTSSRSCGTECGVSWIPLWSIVCLLCSLLKAFLAWPGWKGWRGEGREGGDPPWCRQPSWQRTSSRRASHWLTQDGLRLQSSYVGFEREICSLNSLSGRACSWAAEPSPRSARVAGSRLQRSSHSKVLQLWQPGCLSSTKKTQRLS